jgi:hypothetical protein
MMQRRDKLLDGHSDVLKKWDVGRREMGLLRGLLQPWRPWNKDRLERCHYLLELCTKRVFKFQSPGPSNADSFSTERNGANDALTKQSDAFEFANKGTWRTLMPGYFMQCRTFTSEGILKSQVSRRYI